MRISLPIPTNCTVEGPLLVLAGDCLTVDYDAEDADGSARWARLLFAGVLAFEFRSSGGPRAEDVSAPSEMRVDTCSAYREEVVGRWRATEGAACAQEQREVGSRFQHFALYFDDAAAIDIVASSFRMVAAADRASLSAALENGDGSLNSPLTSLTRGGGSGY